jgi:hypothetical protein
MPKTSYICLLTLILNLGLNFAFLAFTGTIRLPLSQDVKSAIFNDGPTDLIQNYGIHSSPQSVDKQFALQPVVLAMVMYGRMSATEGLVALKSALMHVSRPVEFHIICSPDAVEIIQQKLGLFSRSLNCFFRFVGLKYLC